LTVLSGARKAMAAALGWGDRAMAEAPPLALRDFCAIWRSSPVQNCRPAGLWQARIKLSDGRKSLRSFSVRLLGSAEAKRRAVAARPSGWSQARSDHLS